MLISRLGGVLCAGVIALQVSSAFAEPGISDDKIILGQSAGLTGAAAPQIQDLTAGALAYFEVINNQGGVNGRKIVLESMDDAIDPKRTLDNTNKLISEKHVFALFLYRGTPNVEAVLPLIERERIPLIAPSTGAQSMYVPFKKYLFPVRPSYYAEAEKIVDYLVTPGLRRIAIFHEDGTFGLDVLAGVQSAMKRRKLSLVSVAPYPRGTTNVDAAVTAISASEPQAVVVVGAANASVAFIKKMGALGKRPQFISLSNVNSAAFAQDLGEDGRGVGVTAITPYPYAAITPLAKEYKHVLKDKPALIPSYLSLEGYMAAKVLVEGLRRAGPALTREKLVTALESMRHVDLGGVDISYGPSDRSGSGSVEIVVIGEGGKFLY